MRVRFASPAPRDVLETVRDSERLELLFRNQQSVDLHRPLLKGASRCSQANRRRAREHIASNGDFGDTVIGAHSGTFSSHPVSSARQVTHRGISCAEKTMNRIAEL